MSDDPKAPTGLDLDFGAPTTPAADDPLGALAADLATQIEADVTRKRERETARQVELLRERGLGLEVEVADARAIEVDLRASTLDFEADDGVTVSRRVIREEVRGGSPLRRAVEKTAALLAPVFSLGSNPERLPRVARGLVARGVAAVATAGLIGTLLAGAPGSAYDLTYAPEAARVTYGDGLAPLLTLPDGSGPVEGIGQLSDSTAAGLIFKARSTLSLFDAAVRSGDTAELIAAFTTPEAAAPWAAAATRLHDKGVTRTYIGIDPQRSIGAWEPLGDRAAWHCWGAPIILADLDAQGNEVDRRRLRLLCALFVYRNGSWGLDELALRP